MDLSKDITDPTTDAPILPVITREFVRQLVAKNAEAQRLLLEQGGNPHQLALDQGDEIQAMMVGRCAEDLTKFSRLYVQESEAASLDASHKRIEVKSQTIMDQVNSAAISGNAWIWLKLIAFFVVAIILITIFKGRM